MALTDNDLSASLEDYLEAIYNLLEADRVARSRDIAEALGVSRASVTGALRTLKEKGLIEHEPYGYVTLTEAGIRGAVAVVRKHNILTSFFANVLGIEISAAQSAACRAEHILGPEVIGRLLSFIEFVTDESEKGYDVLTEFREYCSKQQKGKKNTQKRYGRVGNKSFVAGPQRAKGEAGSR
jgi:DtxR family Mn-dependent transcriptional regulator